MVEGKTIQIPYQRVEDILAALERLDNAWVAEARPAETVLLYKGLERAVWSLQLTALAPRLKQFEAVAADTALQLKKQVQCESSGGELELAAPAVEALSVFFLHAARNAVDHGIEAPAERLAAGKPPKGKLRVVAKLDSGKVTVTVTDDGAGPDRAAIVRQAIARGLLTETAAQGLSDLERLALLFSPGFSTREKTSSISGNGVGLEAARSAIVELGGHLVARAPAAGGFELEATLPISPVGLNVTPIRLGDQYFCLPPGAFEKIESPERTPSAGRLARRLGLPEPVAPEFIRLRGLPDGAAVLAVDEIGLPEFKLFRELDPIWYSAGPEWIKKWLKLAGDSLNPLACRHAQSRNVALLADAPLLARLAGA